MAKPCPPQEVIQGEQHAAGLTHVSVFLARAFAAQAADLAREKPVDDAATVHPPGDGAEQ